MKKLSVLIALVLGISFSFGTFASAKEPTKNELKQQVKTLKAENKKLKAENTKLKKSVPSVVSGKIFTNGVQNGTSKFVRMSGRNYVEVDNIIPILTSYTDQQVKYDASGKALYLGIIPSKGVIGLTNKDEYSKDGIYFNQNVSINKQRFTKNIYGYSHWNNNVVVYKIDSKYSKLRFSYGMSDSDKYKGVITISGDGNELFHSGDIDYQTNAKYAEVDVTGVKFLEINSSYNAVLGNPTLAPK
ncbi:NPCBM/NEW2 domain-containing protein [Peribacillus sp. NPDC097198]|uniref:NPCBM/NEW2 domain-containing protein n=1 Tax=Peribacillus sp. NPDC097198 TaxID=3364397 RepID=UPI00380590D4